MFLPQTLRAFAMSRVHEAAHHAAHVMVQLLLASFRRHHAPAKRLHGSKLLPISRLFWNVVPWICALQTICNTLHDGHSMKFHETVWLRRCQVIERKRRPPSKPVDSCCTFCTCCKALQPVVDWTRPRSPKLSKFSNSNRMDGIDGKLLAWARRIHVPLFDSCQCR